MENIKIDYELLSKNVAEWRDMENRAKYCHISYTSDIYVRERPTLVRMANHLRNEGYTVKITPFGFLISCP